MVGFDIEQRESRYPAQLVIQDVLTLHGSQFARAAWIGASRVLGRVLLSLSRAGAAWLATRADSLPSLGASPSLGSDSEASAGQFQGDRLLGQGGLLDMTRPLCIDLLRALAGAESGNGH